MPQLYGILLPLVISPGAADVVTATGPTLRETHVGVALGTRASSANEIGEWAPDPDRGSALSSLLNAAASDAVADFAAIYVQDALAQALPDEALREVDVTVDNRTIELVVTTQIATDPTGRKVKVQTTIQR